MHRVDLARLLRVFTWTGLTSLGGGRSAYFHDAVVVRRGWLTNAEFLQDLTLCQVLPGPNSSHLAVALGHRLAGPWGAWGAALAVLVPGATLLLGLAILYGHGGLGAEARHFLRGMGAAVVGLVLVTAVRLAMGGVRDRRAIAIAALTFLAVGPFRINIAVVIAVMAAVSFWLAKDADPA